MTWVFAHSLSHTKRATILEVVQEFHIGELPLVKSQSENDEYVYIQLAILLQFRLLTQVNGTFNFLCQLVHEGLSQLRVQEQKHYKAERTRHLLAGWINDIVLLRSRLARSTPRFFSS